MYDKLTCLCFNVTYRGTKMGGAFEEAMRKLQPLNPTERIDQRGANSLDDAIWAHLKHINRVHQINNLGLNGEDDSAYNSFVQQRLRKRWTKRLRENESSCAIKNVP